MARANIVELLIKRRADINAFAGVHGTVLIAASSAPWEATERVRTVKILVEHGAEIQTKGRSGDNAMQAASHNGLAEIVALLLLKGADVNSYGGEYGTTLIAACCNVGKEETVLETVKVLITNGADINYLGERYGSALYEAAFCNHSHVVRLLIEARADVNTWNNPARAPLVATCRGKEHNMEIARLLLDSGADINASESYVVKMASMFGTKEMVTFFVNNHASLRKSESGFTALHAAAMYARADIADTLIAFEVDVDSHHCLLGTPLHFACSKEAEELIATGTDEPERVFDSSHERSLEDTTRLLLAKTDELLSGSLYAGLRKKVREKRLALVKLLVEKKADVNARRAGGISVLHDALERDDPELVEFLIANGAIDESGEDGNVEEEKRGSAGTDDDNSETMEPNQAVEDRAC